MQMLDQWDLLKQIRFFVLDMDGTFYLGNQIMDGALDFIAKVKESERDFVFFTNNSSKDRMLYVDKLAAMGCKISKHQILTSGTVTEAYIKANYPNKTVYLLGTPALEGSFLEAGIPLWSGEAEDPELVVVAFDITLTYEKLERACTFLRGGAVYLATHPDINCPTEHGFIPDCGALLAAINLSTGREPKILGKPFAETLEFILSITGCKKNEIAFVGDRLSTDIAIGVAHGAHALLVLTGEATREDAQVSILKPDGIFDNLMDIANYL